MRKVIKKAIQVYKNHGIKGVLRKSRTTLIYRTRHIRPVLKRDTLKSEALREEYGLLSNPVFQITNQHIEASRIACEHPIGKITSATWFVPYFTHFAYGGIQTIFRFIEKLSKEGVYNNIVIYDMPSVDVAKVKAQVAEYFPELSKYDITVFSDDKLESIDKLPASDISFCTMWVSAYFLLRYNKTKRKYYFIQDYEPFFYVAGSTFAMAESTYRFGFRGIVNTPGLLAAVNQRHGLQGISFIPAVNRLLYTPDPTKHNGRIKIFFYARPGNPRNAFVLGILTIRHLLKKYGKKIEIITAGAEWDESEFGLKGKIRNLGLIKSLEEVAALYRSCDIGFAYMLNKHPSYQMLEYAASGVATVMNENEDHHWLYKNEENCLLAEPSPAAMVEQISRLIDDPILRKKLVDGAQAALGYTWDQQTDMIWNDIKSN